MLRSLLPPVPTIRMQFVRSSVMCPLAAAAILMCLAAQSSPVHAQAAGSVQGRVSLGDTREAIPGITVVVVGTRLHDVTDGDGRYSIAGVPVGAHTLRFEWLGFGGREVQSQVAAGAPTTIDVTLEPIPVRLGEVMVTAASRTPERLVDAPAAVSGVEAALIRDKAIVASVPSLLVGLPGVQLVQSGTNDYNLNARGFNGPLNRRVLVLVDGRDVSTPISGNTDWTTINVTEEKSRVEFISGPVSALYGANAIGGVLDIVTPSVREAQGLRLSVAGGEWGSRQASGRYAVVSPDLHWGWRTNAGYSITDGFDRSRTELGHLNREYAGAIDTVRYPVGTPAPGYELRALEGQTKEGAFGLPGRPLGNADAQRAAHLSTRIDYYTNDGAEVTAEGGLTSSANQVVTTTSGRSQNVDMSAPWARLALTSSTYSVNAWYSGRSSTSYGLNSGARADQTSSTLQLEAQTTRRFAGGRGRFVLGASTRRQALDSEGSLFAPMHDGRADGYHAIFGQADLEVLPRLKLVVAGRVDEGSLIDRQLSPRAALVFTPVSGQSIRFTANRAYLTPSALERFIRFPVAPPLDLRALEAGLRASPLGPAMAGVPSGTLFSNSAAVPLLVLGNESLQPQFEKSLELGYRGQWSDRLYLAANLWRSNIRDFITGSFPGVHPPYVPWTAPTAVPEAARAALEGAVRGALGPGITRLEDGTTVYGVSLNTAGRVVERGGDVSVGIRADDRLRFDGNYARYDFDVRQSTFHPADSILPNTPTHTANVGATWTDGDRLRVHANVAVISSFEWRTGFYRGRVPARQTVDVDASYPLTRSLRISVVANNLFDQRRYQIYGGTVIHRRVLLGATWNH